ncbi:cyclic nucleotide-binding domain protein [Dictyocaulus viviparus]|uniref:Cyclic nucleotide-binding domain protein n=1 Tax=Dictyocaulus viviparus TaxID=29172 RepID=A0A0D8XWY2_DICVI|nr:cyclic nucleotide-binding domain protein [Dictyocaulus viviparus]
MSGYRGPAINLASHTSVAETIAEFIQTYVQTKICYPFKTVLIVGTLMASSGLAFLISYYLYGYSSTPHSRSSSSSDSPTRSVRRVRSLIIHESDEDPPTSTKTAKSDVVELRRMRKRDWAKKLYKSLLADSHDRHSSDESNSSQEKNVRPRFLKRRHSTSGPLQIAKDLIRRGSRNYFRHTTEMRDKLPRPPQEYYEPTDLPQIPQNLQPELFYVLHNLKMLELPAEWKLDPRDIEVRSYASGDVILHPGDPDDSIYVAINGTLNVYIASAPSFFKSVSLKAAEPCTVAKFPVRSFRESYNRYPEAWMRPIQIILTRLHHVTMTTLHQYMGLSAELMKRRCDVGLEDRTYHHINGPSRPVPGLALSHKKAKELRISSTDGDTAEQITIARKWFAEALGMQENDGSLIEKIGGINIRSFEEGDLLVEQGSQEEQLILVLSGSLKLSQEPVFDEETQDEDDDNTISRLFPRDLFGGLQLLTNEPSFYTVRAVCKSTVAIMEKTEFNRLLNAHPHIYLPIAHSVLRRLSPFLRAVDFSLDWVLVDTGMAVYREGDSADSMYVMLSGRLRSVEKKTLVEEFGRGDMLGMMEVLQKKPRATTVLAVRFSQLARIPEGLLNFIKLQFPQVGFRLVQLLGQYYSSLHRRIPYPPTTTIEGPGDPINHIKNLHTIAVVPASAEVPLIPFTCELYHALSSNLKVLRLSSQKVATHLDSTVLEKQADFRLMHWLNVQEDTYPLVIYECDYTATNWTRRCLRQADAILVVAMGNKKPHTQTLMRELLSTNQDGARTNKELVLLWPEKTLSPSGTHEWLKDTYYSGHHHIRAPKRMFQWLSRKTRKSSKEIVHLVGEHEVVEYYEKNVFWTVDFRSDFARIARILTGNAIGLALGGGGARGAAHVGVIRALRERGIPIDIVGGTSIGALVAAVYASTPDENVEERTSRWFDGMTSLWRKLLDLTYAHSAMFTGAQLNKSLQSVFEETEIENLWIPYFCISTDITTSEMRVHRSGPLWAYCRASMSLAGYLPPMCDPQDGHLLLDGGYVNNLPADVMKSMGAKCVIAVDVGSSEETNLYNYGDSLSGIWVLLNRLNPWAKSIRILNMEEIQTRLAYVSCVRQLEIVKKAAYCSYFRPPIEPFKTLEFNKFDEILEIGYEYGKKKVEELMESQAFNSLLIGDTSYNLLHRQFNSRRPLHIERSTSFTDLAAALSKIPTVRPMVRHSLSAYDQTEDVFDDIDFLNHSDADNELSQSDFNDASEVEIGPDRQSSCTPRP